MVLTGGAVQAGAGGGGHGGRLGVDEAWTKDAEEECDRRAVYAYTVVLHFSGAYLARSASDVYG